MSGDVMFDMVAEVFWYGSVTGEPGWVGGAAASFSIAFVLQYLVP